MVDEKTLLQQIRDKEQQVSKKIEAVKQETEAVVSIAKEEAGKILRDAEVSGKAAADEMYRGEREKFLAQVEEMKKEGATSEGEAKSRGERNLDSAVKKIVKFVTAY
jgi:V/A-type H+-transporting ATPase subunit G/H